MKDNFFSGLDNTLPFLKAGFEGFAGSGKSRTTAEVAIGLHKRLGSTKPVVIFDTENGARFLKPLFDQNGIQVLVRRSRTLADLIETMKRCRAGFSDILIIDSITHVWEEFIKSYKEKKRSSYMQFQDWGIVKPMWKEQFSEPFVKDEYSILFTGRAGFEYEDERNEETGKREIFKSGIKMKVEGETAYEPDILVLMELNENVIEKKKDIYREATILKDRTDTIDGKTFKNPTYANFSPAIEALISNPVKDEQAPEKDTKQLIHTEEDKREYTRQRDILLEKIEESMKLAWPGQTAAEKKAKLEVRARRYGSSRTCEREASRCSGQDQSRG